MNAETNKPVRLRRPKPEPTFLDELDARIYLKTHEREIKARDRALTAAGHIVSDGWAPSRF